MGALLEGSDLLFTLVLKVGWAAALAALLVRFARSASWSSTKIATPIKKSCCCFS